ncbi:hypothetical protein PLICRDRAFT_99595 [Plicaturopsis crispa FD-325 SS-3]|nr:hypothetical protein PLICRDRAFT_99595 [Plicaturopsis crispa FD-325 SS-3]
MTSTTVPKEFTRGYRPPVQNQDDIPGSQIRLDPPPLDDVTADGLPYKSSGKLEGRAIIVTGADSGIGRSIAILFALEGADLTLAHLPQEEHEARLVEDAVSKKTNGKRRVLLVSADLTDENASQPIIDKHLAFHGHLDTLILNHGTQISQTNLVNMSSDQWHATFNTNIHSFFYLTRAAIPHLRASPTAQPTIVMNASVNMAIGHPELIDYTSTKGAILGFCRALSNQIVGETGIRVNIVAPGPIWTPLIPATMTEESKESFGTTTPIGRAGQPVEVATCFVFLASADSSYISGQTLHVNGGVVIA